jgi:hypothetical protein
MHAYCEKANAPRAPAADTLKNSRLDCDFFMILVLTDDKNNINLFDDIKEYKILSY